MTKITIVACITVLMASCSQSTPKTNVSTNDTVATAKVITEEPQPIASSKAILNTNQIPAQHFEVNPTKPKTIKGKAGVKISIPANAFVNAKGEPVTRNIDIQLKEVVSKKDMVLSGLTTITDDGKLLESDGMYYINATCEGEQLALADGKLLDINVPSKKPNKEMKLWEGEEVNGEMIWKNPGEIRIDIKKIESFGQSVEVEENKRMPTIISVHPVSRSANASEYLLSMGDNTPTVFYLSNNHLQDSLKLVPELMSYNDYRLISISELSNLFFTDNWTEQFIQELKDTIIERKERNLKPEDINQVINNVTTFEVKNELSEKVNFNPHTVSKEIGYKLKQNKLGWANIDRYYGGNVQVCELDVDIDISQLSDDATFDICLISKGRNFYIPGYRRPKGTFGFTHGEYEKAANMPIGEKAVILAIFKDGDKTYLGNLDFTIKQKATERLLLKEISNDALDAELDKVLN